MAFVSNSIPSYNSKCGFKYTPISDQLGAVAPLGHVQEHDLGPSQYKPVRPARSYGTPVGHQETDPMGLGQSQAEYELKSSEIGYRIEPAPGDKHRSALSTAQVEDPKTSEEETLARAQGTVLSPQSSASCRGPIEDSIRIGPMTRSTSAP